MSKKILETIDFKKINKLLESFNKLTGFVTAILDVEGNVLSKSGWRRICTEFHRVNKETSKNCKISDTTLANANKNNDFNIYKCKNGLVDVAVPIIIKGEHIATLFTGQFFFEEPNKNFFIKQAEKYSFDKEEYLDRLSEVPIVGEEELDHVMEHLQGIIEIIIHLTLDKLEQEKISEMYRTEKDRAEQYLNNLELTSKIFEASIDNAPIPIMIHSEDGMVLNISKTWTELTLYTKADIPTIYKWTEKAYGKGKEEVREFIRNLYSIKNTQSDGEFEVTTKDGRKLKWDFYSMYIGDLPDGRAVAMSAATDVTNRKKREDEIQYLSYHDSLTNLENRRSFDMRLKELDTDENYPLTLVMGDINGLKLVNDAFGHKEGDSLLVSAADIISSLCKDSDVVARMGGDEFIMALPNTTSNEAEILVNKIREKARKVKVNSIELSISFGFSTKHSIKQNLQEIRISAEDKMYREKLNEIPSMRSSAIGTILSTLHEKDKNSETHSKLVSKIAVKIAMKLGMNREKINEIKTAGLLHDIGKIMVPTAIITKKGTLTEEEYDLIKKHPEIGYRILSSSKDLRDISEIILFHHERYDGKGYPNQMSGDEIPIQSRIIAIADAFDAMTSQRPYREPMSKIDALTEIINNAGTQFDPDLADLFVKNFENIINAET